MALIFSLVKSFQKQNFGPNFQIYLSDIEISRKKMKFSGGVNHLLGQIQNGMSELGKVSRKKIAVLLNFVQIVKLNYN